MSNGGRAVIDGNFATIFRDRDCVVRHADDPSESQNFLNRILGRFARTFVDDAEHVILADEPLLNASNQSNVRLQD